MSIELTLSEPTNSFFAAIAKEHGFKDVGNLLQFLLEEHAECARAHGNGASLLSQSLQGVRYRVAPGGWENLKKNIDEGLASPAAEMTDGDWKELEREVLEEGSK